MHCSDPKMAPIPVAVLDDARGLQGVSSARGLVITSDGATAYVPVDDGWTHVWELDLRARGAAALPGPLSPRVVRKLNITVDAAAHGAEEEGVRTEGAHGFEAATLLPCPGTTGGSAGYNGKERERLVVFGPHAGLRDAIRFIDLRTGKISLCDAISLMTALRTDARVTGAGAPLNIKAAAGLVSGTKLALFNRGNAPGGVNSVVVIKLVHFLQYLDDLFCAGKAADGSPGSKEDGAARVLAPEYKVVHLKLPPVSGSTPGQSVVQYGAIMVGAATMTIRTKGKCVARGEILLLAASHATDGGEVLGTRLAALSSEALLSLAMEAQSGGRVLSLNLEQVGALVTMPAGGPVGSSGSGGEAAPVTARIEGVAVHRATIGPSGDGDDVIDVLAVTEPNGGASQLLQVRMRVPSGNWQHCHDDVYERRPRSRPPPNFVIPGTT